MFREMRRIQQQMTAAECEELLCQAPRGILAVLGDDAYPYTVPMNYIYADGKLWFHGAVEGHKYDAVMKQDKVSFCVLSEGEPQEGEWWLRFCSVVVFGRISIVTDEKERELRLRQLAAKYNPSPEDIEDDIRRHAAKSLVYMLEPEHITGKRVKEK